MAGNFWEALFFNGLLLGLTVRVRALSLKGAVVMALMGFWIFLALGWRGYLIPIGFFTLASLFTHLGYERKRNRQVAQQRGGTRGPREVLANGLVPLLFTLPMVWLDSKLFTLGYIGAWATALCDTSSTELGNLWGRRSYLIKNFHRVNPGTAGAVSLEGTTAGFVAGSSLISLAYALRLVNLRLVLPLCFAALLGSMMESYLAEIIPPSIRVKHELLNLLNTSLGGGFALLGGILWLTPE